MRVPSGALQTKAPENIVIQGFQNKSGIVLLSHAVTHIVPSALRGLTSLFGMGRGVTPSILTPEETQLRNVFEPCFPFKTLSMTLILLTKKPSLNQQKIMAKPIDLLVLLDSSVTGLTSVAYQPSHLLGVLSA